MKRFIKIWFVSALVAAMVSGCITQEKCNLKYPPKSGTEISVTYLERDTTIRGLTVSDSPSIRRVVTLPVNVPVIVKDTAGLAQLRYWRDAYGNLLIECESLDRTLKLREAQIKETKTVVHEVKVEVVPLWVWIVIPVLVLIIILILIRR